MLNLDLTQSPNLHAHSDIVPAGHTQLQKPLWKRNDVTRMDANMIKPAGCNGSTAPVPRKYLSPINAPIGKNASIPGGLAT